MTPIKHLLKGQEIDLACLHWKEFPPTTALTETPVLELRANKQIPEAAYQQHLVWERVCNKRKMDAGCSTCPFARKLELRNHLPPMLMNLDGSGGTAIHGLDFGQMETRPVGVARLESVKR